MSLVQFCEYRVVGSKIGAKKLDKNERKREWIREISALNLEPFVTIIERTNYENVFEREAYWINHYKSIGADLLNMPIAKKYKSLI